MKVLDGIVFIFSAVEGVQPQSEANWREIEEKLTIKPVAVQIPVGAEEQFEGVIDLMEMKAIIWLEETLGAKYEVRDIPSEYLDKAREWREKMIETIVETDDELMEKYLEGEEIDTESLRKALRKATIERQLVPILCGSAFKNKGVQPLLDAVIDYLPSPVDLPPIKGTNPETGETEERKPLDTDPFCAYAFKVMSDPYAGQLTYIRVFSGTLKAGSYVLNVTRGEKQRVGRLLLIEICAVVGLDAATGDTLADEKHPIVLEKLEFPDPVISMAIEPKTKKDQEKHPETGQTLIHGMGELHLEIMVDRMKREYKIEVNVGKPQVAYKETIRRKATGEGKFIRQTGGRGQYGHAVIEIEPLERGAGFIFENAIVGGVIPKEFIPAVEKGIREAMEGGVIAGYPVVDVKVRLYDGSYHEVDSSEIAFQIAGSMAFKEAAKKADPVLLEPIMEVEVETPEDYVGDVIGDLNSRRGRIMGMENKGVITVVKAHVPLAEMFGYATTLRSLTQGRGTFIMKFSHYDEVPQHIAEKIIGERLAGKSA